MDEVEESLDTFDNALKIDRKNSLSLCIKAYVLVSFGRHFHNSSTLGNGKGLPSGPCNKICHRLRPATLATNAGAGPTKHQPWDLQRGRICSAREVAAVEKTDYFNATEKIENVLNNK